MKKGGRLFLVVTVTIAFLVVVGLLQFLHMQAETTPVALPPDQLLPFDPSLRTDFFDDLQTRQANQLGSELGY